MNNNLSKKNTLILNKKITCLIIGDGTIGMQNQSIALAEGMNLNYKLIELSPTWLPRIFPTMLAGKYFLHLSNKDYEINTENPDIIITCGRRMAGISVGLKRLALKSKNNIINIHIQNPKLSNKYFDYLIVPEHDNLIGKNVITSKGSLHQITYNSILNSFKNLHPKILKGIGGHIAVIIGGDTKNQIVKNNEINNLIIELSRIQKLIKTKMIISLSRRTTYFISKKIKEYSNKNNIILWEPNDIYPNPYPGLFYNAKLVIVTTDSINMLSESISTGLPVFGFDLLKPHSRRNTFIKNLIEEGYLKNTNQLISIKSLKNFKKIPSNEAQRIGKKLIKAIH